jgi:signal transduction histidine kinase
METNRRLQERAQQLEIINELTISLTSTIELEALLELILDKAIALLNTEAGTFMVAIPDTGELEFKVVRGPASAHLVGTRLPVGTGLAGTAAQTGRPVIVNRVHDDDRWFASVDQNTAYDSHSILTVPMIRQNTALGVLQVINKRNGGQFVEEDQRLLLAFAGQAVVAMENARLLEQTDLALKNSVDELFMLQQLDRDLNTTLDLTHVLNLTLDRTLAICKADAGAILLLDEEGKPYRIVTRGYDSWFDPYDIDVQSGLVGKVIASEEPYITGDVHQEPDYVTANSRTKSQMTLPLTNKQQLIGVISIESFGENAYAALDVETAVRVTNHAAVAIANAVLYEQINEANLAKSEFVSMVSHELKTPMTSMRGYTDLLLSGMTGELNVQQRNFLETIAANIQRMGQQIQDLTDISRIETGRLHIVAAPTSIIDVMNETLQTVKPLCEEKDVRLHLQLPDDLPMVFVDKNRLVQVMTNLLSNACKYSPSDTDVQVIFEEKSVEQENGHEPHKMVQCSVADRGYGISEADQKKLFTKFFRSDDPNIRQAKGTGLGLSITKGIIEIQGGEIWVKSEIGKGTTFAFTMPRA